MTTNEFYLNNIWVETLNKIENTHEISDDVFKMYLSTSKLIKLEEKAVVYVPSFIAYVVMNDAKTKTVIENCLEEITNRYFEVEIIKQGDEPVITETNPFFKREIDPSYTFGNFVVGRSNAQAQFASLTITANLGLLYNPLFIYGNSGLGKTHLLNAIGNQVKQTKPNAKICYISGLDFVEGVSKSAKEKRIDEFKESFNDVDLLLIDDIQFIAGKDKTHEVFFTVFNNLVNNKKQVCLTADKLPSEINGLEDRIISRFNQGLNVNIEAPEYETSLNIIKMKISNNFASSKDIDDDVLSFIATNFSQDVRSLEGAINRLLFYAINFKTDEDRITIKTASEAFKDQIIENKNEISISQIKKVVAEYYNLTVPILVGKNKTANISTARHIAIYLCRKLLDAPYKEIGDAFGNRDHSTIISACEKVDKNIKTNSLYMKAINEIEARLKN